MSLRLGNGEDVLSDLATPNGRIRALVLSIVDCSRIEECTCCDADGLFTVVSLNNVVVYEHLRKKKKW